MQLIYRTLAIHTVSRSQIYLGCHHSCTDPVWFRVLCFTALQVFRVFRQVSEEQRKMSEGRYRCVLLEAVQDAVYLSAQNQQLQADNKQLHKGQCTFNLFH